MIKSVCFFHFIPRVLLRKPKQWRRLVLNGRGQKSFLTGFNLNQTCCESRICLCKPPSSHHDTPSMCASVSFVNLVHITHTPVLTLNMKNSAGFFFSFSRALSGSQFFRCRAEIKDRVLEEFGISLTVSHKTHNIFSFLAIPMHRQAVVLNKWVWSVWDYLFTYIFTGCYWFQSLAVFFSWYVAYFAENAHASIQEVKSQEQ